MRQRIDYGRPVGPYEKPGPRSLTAYRSQCYRLDYPELSPLPNQNAEEDSDHDDRIAGEEGE